jgi:hypothetical protein
MGRVEVEANIQTKAESSETKALNGDVDTKADSTTNADANVDPEGGVKIS